MWTILEGERANHIIFAKQYQKPIYKCPFFFFFSLSLFLCFFPYLLQSVLFSFILPIFYFLILSFFLSFFLSKEDTDEMKISLYLLIIQDCGCKLPKTGCLRRFEREKKGMGPLQYTINCYKFYSKYDTLIKYEYYAKTCSSNATFCWMSMLFTYISAKYLRLPRCVRIKS